MRSVTDLASETSRHDDAEPSEVFSAAWFRSRGDRPALVCDALTSGSGEAEVLSYAELADRIDIRRLALGRTRRLVLIGGTDDVEAIITLFAALDGGHPLLVTDGGPAVDSLVERYRPDTVVSAVGDGVDIEHRTAWSSTSSHDLHPDLALLMNTSGTTGGAKLVRLSSGAVRSNAIAIGQALGLTSEDRAITSLPFHYCFGMSVVTSHLAVGGSVVVTGASVVDPCFWDVAARERVSTLAGVPYTFEMVERVGLDVMRASSLRLVMQAGGRMEPDAVRRFVAAGAASGWDFVVMYGQTEATARMAIASAADMATHPTSVGRAIPGGSFRIDTRPDLVDRGAGEVVYTGPNVMMGYATRPADLARGPELAELFTGDLGRLDDDGRLELVGRASRFIKVHGKRVDLDHLEARLSSSTRRIRCFGDDDGLVVVTVGISGVDGVDGALADEVCELVDLPPARIAAADLHELPRTASGKVDAPAVVSRVRGLMRRGAERRDDDSVLDAFRMVLGREEIDDRLSFADLGGDSFSYVEMSVRLERILGELPADWHLRPIVELEALGAGARSGRWWSRVDTSVVIRAVAILLIVCTHMRVYRLPGGAHALLAVVGFNIARFQLLPRDVPGRLRRSVSTIARVAVPTSAWIGLNMLLVGGYSVGAMLLVNNYIGDAARRGGHWEYWYFEAFVQVMIVVAVLFAIPAVRRGERRAPFGFALAVLGVTLLFRFDVVRLGGDYNAMFRTHTVACFVALGWCAQRAATRWQRAAVSVGAVVTTVGYFGQSDRELRIIVAILALTWIPTVLVPRPVAVVLGPLAAASMWIFLVHWQVWPVFTPWMHDGLAFWLTIASGVGVWWCARAIERSWSGRRGGVQRRTVGRSTSSQVSDADTTIRSNDATPVSA